MAHSLEEKDGIRNRILDAAVLIIENEGLAKLTARGVAREAGLAASGLYNFFGDFDDIVVGANSRTLGLLDKALTATARKHAKESVADRFLALALAYMKFSQKHQRLWLALFEHRLPDEKELPVAHKQEHYILFRHVEAPLAEIMPGRTEDEIRTIARTIYSSVHGVVSLGLQGRLDRVPVSALTNQLSMLTKAFATGYAAIGSE